MEQLTDKQREEIQEIMDNMSCKVDFECYKSSLENICRGEYNEHGFVLKIGEIPPDKSILSYDCRYRFYLGNRYNYYICRCPLRIHIAEKLRL